MDEAVVRANRLEDRGMFGEAITAHKKIIESHPGEKRSLNAIAGLYGKMGQFRNEVEWARRALQSDPSYSMAYVNLGNGLLGLGRDDEANAAFVSAAKLAPTASVPVYSIGLVEERRGNRAAAEAQYRKSVSLDPRFEDGWFNLAALLANERRFKEAREALAQVLKLNPRANDARRMLKDIEASERRKDR